MLQLLGSPAHSEFRRRKLLAQCRERVPAVAGLYADYLHLAELIEPLPDPELRRFEQLLEYGAPQSTADRQGSRLVVVPRPGTISPWSSKATDIVHNCGLDKVRRVERGIIYTVETAAGEPLQDDHAESSNASPPFQFSLIGSLGTITRLSASSDARAGVCCGLSEERGSEPSSV